MCNKETDKKVQEVINQLNEQIDKFNPDDYYDTVAPFIKQSRAAYKDALHIVKQVFEIKERE